jgi:hypothetical protein
MLAGAAGSILHDYWRALHRTINFIHSNVSSEAPAEAIAMRDGLALADRRGCNNIITESDSMEFIQACSSDKTWWGETSAIFVVCVYVFALIGKVDFQYLSKECKWSCSGISFGFFFYNNLVVRWINPLASFLRNL